IRLYYSKVRKPEDGLIFKLKYSQYLENFDKLWLISKDSVVSGLLDTYEKRRLRRDVDEELLKDLVYCRRLLVSNVRKNNPQLSKEEINEATQKILDRLMFIRSCEDRLIIPAESLWTQFSVWQKIAIDKSVRTFMMDLKNIFRDFDAVYNGQLFAPHLCEDLRIDNEVLQSILILLYNYNFDLIPVNVLGNAYELYIGTIIKEKEGTLKEDELTLVEDPSVRKKHGIYYTPEYVVDYIVRNTLGEMLKNCKRVEEVSRIKVLDPACGSGSFLIKAFDVINEWYDNYNKQNRLVATPNTLDAHFQAVSNVEEKILTENIYGVDLDPQAVEITIMNLSLKAVKTRKRLPYMGDHIKCGNSLVSGSKEDLENYFGESWKDKKPFNWETEFPEVFRESGFDVVLGNPPYINVSNLPDEERAYLMEKYESALKRFDIFIGFIERGLKLLKEGGRLSFIIPYPFLTQNYAEKLRRLILTDEKIGCAIEQIVDLSQFKIFQHAEVRNIIVVLRKERNAEKRNQNVVKILTPTEDPNEINEIRGVISHIPQRIFLETPENMIRLGLNEKTMPIIEKVKKSSVPFSKIFVASWGARGVPVSVFHLDKPINNLCKKMVKGENIRRYMLTYEGKWFLYDRSKLYRPSFPELFENEKILINKVTGPTGLIGTFDDERYYTDDSVCCCVPKYLLKNVDKNVLMKHKLYISDEEIEISRQYSPKYVLAIINSKLMNFYFSILLGYELNVYPESLEQLPIYKIDFSNKKEKEKHDELSQLADKMLSLNKQLKTVNVDFDRYITEPIIGYTNFKSYYDKLDVKDKEALDKTSNGTIKRVTVEEQESWLIFKVDYFIRKGKTKEEFADIPVLRCKFEDAYFRKFLLYTFLNYKQRWKSGNLLSIILKTPIPCFDKNPDKNKQIIERIMEEFLR
ncbi:MAG: N-6 DNA methylase, partial [Nitrososphaeria archaeon]